MAINPTQITPPRVAFIDPLTGAISREWYRFFLSLWTAQLETQDVNTGYPDTSSALASYDAALAALAQSTGSLPPVDQLQTEIDNVRQELQTLTRPELGTMAALQQDNIGYLRFNNYPSPLPPTTAGTISWNDTGGIDFHMGVPGDHTGLSNITQQVGEELYIYGKASAIISDSPLQIIYKTGTVGASGTITFAPTIAGLTNPGAIIGIATEPISKNNFGRATAFGVVHNITTNGAAYGETWADNDDIWYNPVTGNPTKTEPTAPNMKVKVGTVINAGSGGSGSFQVLLQPGSILGGTDSNVQFGTLADKDLIQYNSTLKYWTNVTPASVIASSGGPPVTKTADFTVAGGETWIINNKSGSSCTATLPTASANNGRVLYFQNYQVQTLVSASSNVIPIGGGAASTSILLASAGDMATLVSNGTDWVMMQYIPNNILLLE